MKMKADDYAALERAIKTRFSASDRFTMWARYSSRNLSATRYRWDLLRASDFNISALYNAGLNDSHIDTALRSILPILDDRAALPARFPGWRHMTAVQRRNARMHAMFERARTQATMQDDETNGQDRDSYSDTQDRDSYSCGEE